MQYVHHVEVLGCCNTRCPRPGPRNPDIHVCIFKQQGIGVLSRRVQFLEEMFRCDWFVCWRYHMLPCKNKAMTKILSRISIIFEEVV